MAVGGQIQIQMAASCYCWIGESGEIRFDEGEPISAGGNLLRATDLDGNWDELLHSPMPMCLRRARKRLRRPLSWHQGITQSRLFR